jgi:hypothetical protein
MRDVIDRELTFGRMVYRWTVTDKDGRVLSREGDREDYLRSVQNAEVMNAIRPGLLKVELFDRRMCLVPDQVCTVCQSRPRKWDMDIDGMYQTVTCESPQCASNRCRCCGKFSDGYSMCERCMMLSRYRGHVHRHTAARMIPVIDRSTDRHVGWKCDGSMYDPEPCGYFEPVD